MLQIHDCGVTVTCVVTLPNTLSCWLPICIWIMCCSRVSWGGFDLEKKEEKVDGSSGLFIYGWDTTAVEPSKSGTRSQLPVIVFLENGEQVGKWAVHIFTFKCQTEGHCVWNLCSAFIGRCIKPQSKWISFSRMTCELLIIVVVHRHASLSYA